jgi:hypothetical protein
MNNGTNQINVELCIKCKKYTIEIDSDPYCDVCWIQTCGYLLQIPPLKVLSVINEGKKTYKEIMTHTKLKAFHKKSSHSVAIPLRSLIRKNLVYMSNRISGTYDITKLGVIVLDKMKKLS